ncbi:uncharacterized protein BXZ73DRAFT_21330, partial [Epithele typhae]|uniref:uncharacterized protein n=1 Tax=Epithele typhae TaxID=378194 RepID=UPI0020088F60
MQLVAFVFALAVSVFATPLTITPRDVVAPPIIVPTAQTMWTVGEKETVTWDTSVLEGVTPSNPNGTLLLGTFVDGQEHLMGESPLATDFSLFDGNVTLTVPSVAPGKDYIVCLIGDSGNISPAFTILGAGSSSG